MKRGLFAIAGLMMMSSPALAAEECTDDENHLGIAYLSVPSVTVVPSENDDDLPEITVTRWTPRQPHASVKIAVLHDEGFDELPDVTMTSDHGRITLVRLARLQHEHAGSQGAMMVAQASCPGELFLGAG